MAGFDKRWIQQPKTFQDGSGLLICAYAAFLREDDLNQVQRDYLSRC
jgi:hypothetical protein